MQHVRARQSRQPEPEPIEGSFEQAIARKLQSRGIIAVPGLPSEPEPQWYDLAIEMNRRQAESEAQRQAEREAAEADQNRPPSLPAQIVSAIAGKTGNQIPLNGAAVLKAALAGGQGTVNGAAR